VAKKKDPFYDSGVPKKSRLRETFPGQTHFPEVSSPIGRSTVIVLIALAIVISVVVWWLKS
jgi:hypothetical protein